MESDTLVAYESYDATAATTEGQEQEASTQSRQIARQLELETERNQLGNPGILKATSGNTVKRWEAKNG